MDASSRVDQIFSRAIDEQVEEQRSLRKALEEVRERLTAVEQRLTELEAAPARELEAVSNELGRRISELGRLLVRDLGRLPQLLERHRDAIVAELRESSTEE